MPAELWWRLAEDELLAPEDAMSLASTCKSLYAAMDVPNLRRQYYTDCRQAINIYDEPWLEGDMLHVDGGPCDVPSAEEGEHVRFYLRRLFSGGFIRRVQCQCSAWRSFRSGAREFRRPVPVSYMDVVDEDLFDVCKFVMVYHMAALLPVPENTVWAE